MTIQRRSAMTRFMEELKTYVDNLGIKFVHRHPFVCPYYNIKTHHCMEREAGGPQPFATSPALIDVPTRCLHPFLETEDGDVICMLELEEEFDWDALAGRLKIHKGGNT